MKAELRHLRKATLRGAVWLFLFVVVAYVMLLDVPMWRRVIAVILPQIGIFVADYVRDRYLEKHPLTKEGE